MDFGNALASDLDEVICVTRELNSARRQINIADERLFWLINYAADRGQSTSVMPDYGQQTRPVMA
jgi:CTP:molybdopterin cytidylyltransferase MocA